MAPGDARQNGGAGIERGAHLAPRDGEPARESGREAGSLAPRSCKATAKSSSGTYRRRVEYRPPVESAFRGDRPVPSSFLRSNSDQLQNMGKGNEMVKLELGHLLEGKEATHSLLVALLQKCPCKSFQQTLAYQHPPCSGGQVSRSFRMLGRIETTGPPGISNQNAACTPTRLVCQR